MGIGIGLIKLVGRAVADRIQRGSTRGAVLGGIAGTVVGIVLAYWRLTQTPRGPEGFDSLYLGLAILFAFIGMLIGATVGPKRPPLSARSGVRLTRYNEAGGVLAIFLIVTTAAIALLFVHNDKSEFPDYALVSIKCTLGGLALLAGVTTARSIWSVELGKTIFVRRTIVSKMYSSADLQFWGFATRSGKFIQHAFEGEMILLLQFSDGLNAQFETRGEDSPAIVALLPAVKQPQS